VISLIIGLALFIVYFVGLVQIITKAGFSPWWVLVPLSLPILWFIEIGIVFNGFGNLGTYGAVNVQAFADEGAGVAGLIFLDIVFNFVMFLVFAFSEWPVMQAARNGYRSRGGGSAPGRPSYDPRTGPGGGVPYGAVAPSTTPSDMTGQPPGWQRSGAVGAGEQSYWDGSAWTARRRWQSNAWVDLPLEATAPVGTEPETSAESTT
jgi:hypothetical protein